MKKYISLFILAAIVGVFAAGCSQATDAGTTAPEAGKEGAATTDATKTEGEAAKTEEAAPATDAAAPATDAATTEAPKTEGAATTEAPKTEDAAATTEAPKTEEPKTEGGH